MTNMWGLGATSPSLVQGDLLVQAGVWWKGPVPF